MSKKTKGTRRNLDAQHSNAARQSSRGWALTAKECGDPLCNEIWKKIHAIPRVNKWIELYGSDEICLDLRARSLLIACHNMVFNGRMKIPTRTDFGKWVNILETFEGRMRQRSDHPLSSYWIDKDLAPAIAKSIKQACAFKESTVLNPKHPVHQVICELSKSITQMSGGRRNHELVADLANVLVPMIDPADERPTKNPFNAAAIGKLIQRQN